MWAPQFLFSIVGPIVISTVLDRHFQIKYGQDSS